MIKVGDIVTIKLGKKDLPFDQLPKSWIGRRARVTSIEGASVYVFFVEKKDGDDVGGPNILHVSECLITPPTPRRILPEWF